MYDGIIKNFSNRMSEKLTKEFTKSLDEKLTEALSPLRNELRKMPTKKELNDSIKSSEERIKENLTRELNPLKEKISLMEDKIAFYSYQVKGGETPKEVRRVPGGYGLLEPRSSWRRERYGR